MKSVKKFFAVGFALIVAFTNIQFVKAEAAETETKTENTAEVADEKESTKPAIQMVSKVDVKYSADNPSLPVLNGYYFAGWYKTDKPEENPKVLNKDEVYTSTPEEGEEAWAKFVPEKVLTVVAQIPVTVKETQNPDGGKTPLRLVTTVDNLYYREVGFTITINGKSIPQEAKTVYKQLFAVGDAGELDTKTPETSFCDVSHYFAACTIDNIPKEAWNTEIQVVPYWITLDGTRVEGTSVVKEVEMGRDNQARIGNDWYWTLNYAIQQANKVTSGAPVVQVLRDIKLTSGITITNSMTITTDGSGVDKKITTAVNSRIFHINGSGNDVTIKGTETERLILEGTGETASTQQLIYAQSCQKATLENVDVKNANREATSSSSGGAINSACNLEVKNCSFTNCKMNAGSGYTGSGGAIYCSAVLTLDNCLFEKCESKNNGGAIIGADSAVLTIKNCTFKDCVSNIGGSTATNGGGAIRSSGAVTLDNSKFTACQANVNGGAINCTAILTLNDCSFEKCEATMDGGAIKGSENLTATNCAFTGCNSLSVSTGSATYGGGAINNDASVTLQGCNFENCTGKRNGGAINCAGILTLEQAGEKNCEFKECSTDNYGGAIYCTKALNASNSNFESCSAAYGGAIYKTGADTECLFNACTFNKNEATNNGGGAVHVASKHTVNIKDCKFTENKALSSYGGAVSIGTATSTLNLLGSCKFINNSAKGTGTHAGGAMLAPTNLNIGDGTTPTEVIMTGNECTGSGYGDAISINADKNTANFNIKDNAKLYVYDNPTAGDGHSDICVKNGEDITPKTGEVITTAP